MSGNQELKRWQKLRALVIREQGISIRDASKKMRLGVSTVHKIAIDNDLNINIGIGGGSGGVFVFENIADYTLEELNP